MERQDVSIYLDRAQDIWYTLCQLHNELLEKTCDEYLALLASDLDLLEEIVSEKESILRKIDLIDKDRKDLIATINKRDQIQSVGDLIGYFYTKQLDAKNIEKLNMLLIDIIQKITAQNKKNQSFLNKAIHTLNELKGNFKGQSQYNIYTKRGHVTTKSV
jgi:flagellar biosynthesis/type III secretory pathway chaperone